MDAILSAAVSILFHGVAYAMVLYLISVGLSVTMGLMGFANLAHGMFAMVGGYVAVTLMNGYGVPLALAIPVACAAVAAIAAVLERTLYARLYRAGELEQVLFTIGLVFIAIAAAHYVWGPLPQRFEVPELLRGQVTIGGRAFPTYRLFLIAIGG